MQNGSAISIRNVQKKFGTFVALENVSLDIRDNEFFTLLGPSGCGKTTLLRMIAGFESPSAGEIFLYGDEIENLPPDKRPVNTVFQNYALFPHMTVSENVSFGLRMLGWSADDMAARTSTMITLVKLEEFAQRKPAQLSGGQQQRVALARAMAPQPKVLLLDEPLSALDLKLRQAMRSELKQLQQETGITFIFVTHDQEEALSMSDRIAVMSAGELQQIGTPAEIYEAPANTFVADFIGDTNLLRATVKNISRSNTGKTLFHCELDNGLALVATADSPVDIGTVGSVSIRPEHLSIQEPQHTDNHHNLTDRHRLNTLTGTLKETTYFGTDKQLIVQLGSNLLVQVRQQNTTNDALPIQHGEPIQLNLPYSAVRFLQS